MTQKKNSSTWLTVEKVRELIQKASPLELEIIWIPRIIRNQTSEEVRVNSTLEFNGVGLNGCDAHRISYYYKLTQKGYHLKPDQAEDARKKLIKYARQYIEQAEVEKNRAQACPA